MNQRSTALLISSSLLLVACGGGGGSSGLVSVTPTVSATPTPVATPVATPKAAVALETNAQAAAAGISTLNAMRTSCGMDALSLQNNLVAAADAAGNYFKLRVEENDSTYSHTQTVGKTGFTGVTPWDRAAAAGYPIPVGLTLPRIYEDLSTTVVPANWVLQSKVEDAKIQTENLINTVYHLLDLMSPVREVGANYIEAVGASGVGASYSRITFETGTQAASDVTALGNQSVVTYPCEGVTAIAAFKPNAESPNPLPDLGEAIVGTPIGIRAPTGTTISIATYTVLDDAGAVVASRLMSPNGLQIPYNKAAIIPLSALTVGKTYRVVANGSFSGNGFPVTPVAINFSFKTKAATVPKLIPR